MLQGDIKLSSFRVDEMKRFVLTAVFLFRCYVSQVMDFKVRSADDQNLQGMKASKCIVSAQVG